MASFAWPELPFAAWKDTLETLHRWTQIAGKVRLKLTPWLNQSCTSRSMSRRAA